MEDFGEDFDFGKKGEELFYNEILPILSLGDYQKIENLKDQSNQGDFKSGDNFYEIKTRKSSYFFEDILIELSHEGKSGIEGWLLKYQENTFLVYLFTKVLHYSSILITYLNLIVFSLTPHKDN